MRIDKLEAGHYIFIILVAIGLSFLIAYVDRPMVYEAGPETIPPRPDSENLYYYDFDSKTFTPIYQHPRANDTIKPSRYQEYIHEYKRELDDEDIQDYLEDHVDGYFEDTYWGSEYDINDLEDDED